MLTLVLTTLQRQRGLTTVEYAIGGALIAVVVIAALLIFGPTVAQVFNGIEDKID
jgi:Flp pilus assembly pilin Flp